MQSSTGIENESGPGRSDFSADQADKMPSRRKACNECKQQKVQTLPNSNIINPLPGTDHPHSFDVILPLHKVRRSRILVLGADVSDLAVELTMAFVGLENDGKVQVRQWRKPCRMFILTKSLQASQRNPSNSSQHNETSWPVPASVGTPGAVFNALNQTDTGLIPPHSVTNDTDLQCLTTRPGNDQPTHDRASFFPLARPRALGNIILQIEEIDELFNMYIKYNHPYLPLIDEEKSPHEYYERSELLFWVIMAVAARRQKSQPTLLPRLARNVTDLLWKTLRSMSYSISTIRALCLLCTWPFPTSSSTSDPTFMLVGSMLQMSTQMGLHCVLDAQDFVKVPLQLDVSERSEWARTWEACNIVAISVSIGCGLPLFFQMYETPSASQFESSPADSPFYFRLQIERFKLRVSLSFARPMPTDAEGALTRERSTMYNLLNSDLDELEKRLPGSCAYSLMDLSQRLNGRPQGFFDYYPFFCYQTYVNAAFVLLKILTNGFFNTIIDVQGGKQLLESAITALRQMSVVNNDLPARLGDIIGFFCALPDPAKKTLSK
ncbi:unnamed protein product [Fusarium equiseti]|uniref:Xylanolytic transcriptional activator regulatory domain-containing protein n=1 Tax=Fusarium equiseti TaxID=61235 RepID=A0A8J2IVY4_FUSEQ|nr:unnamed protein product [Fusarium equiseti]